MRRSYWALTVIALATGLLGIGVVPARGSDGTAGNRQYRGFVLGVTELRLDVGNGALQDGYLRYFNDNTLYPAQTYEHGLGVEGALTVSLRASEGADFQWRDRSPLEGGPCVSLSPLVSDFVFAGWDQSTLTLTLTTLITGQYAIKTYHHDIEFGNHGAIRVVVHDALGARTAVDSLVQTTGASPLSVASTQLDVFSDGQAPVIIDFQMIPGTGNAAVLNGLDIATSTDLGVSVDDVPDDQGGQIQVSWRHHALDSDEYSLVATNYEVQRYDAAWTTTNIIAATRAESYFVVLPTACILTPGQPTPYARYRVIVRTTSPSLFFYSDPDSGYSIDNLPPDPPALSLYDSETYRSLSWVNPTAPDFGNSCLYRGTEPGFEAGDPLICSDTQYWYQETDLNRYWYRARSFDIHGNASEWSNEVVGRYPTDVPGVPTVLRLHPNQPNPFNPMTTLRFDVPVGGRGVRGAGASWADDRMSGNRHGEIEWARGRESDCQGSVRDRNGWLESIEGKIVCAGPAFIVIVAREGR